MLLANTNSFKTFHFFQNVRIPLRGQDRQPLVEPKRVQEMCQQDVPHGPRLRAGLRRAQED